HLSWRRGKLERRTGERTGAERALGRGLRGRGEPRTVAVEHLDPREKVVAERDRLRALEVGVPRHDALRLGLGEREHDESEGVDRLTRLRAGIEDVHAERRGHLIVARPAGVDLAADVAEETLDRRVHVLVGLEVGVRILSDLRKSRLDLLELLAVQAPCSRESTGVLGGRLTVVRQELRVVDAQEAPHVGVKGTLAAPGPGGHTWILALSRAACNSVSRDEIRMNPSAASCG